MLQYDSHVWSGVQRHNGHGCLFALRPAVQLPGDSRYLSERLCSGIQSCPDCADYSPHGAVCQHLQPRRREPGQPTSRFLLLQLGHRRHTRSANCSGRLQYRRHFLSFEQLEHSHDGDLRPHESPIGPACEQQRHQQPDPSVQHGKLQRASATAVGISFPGQLHQAGSRPARHSRGRHLPLNAPTGEPRKPAHRREKPSRTVFSKLVLCECTHWELAVRSNPSQHLAPGRVSLHVRGGRPPAAGREKNPRMCHRGMA